MGEEIHRAWLATARRQPSRCAVREADGTQVSFAELQRRVGERLDALTGRARWRNRIVALQLENSAAWLEAFLVCQALDAVALPFDTDVPEAGKLAILSALRPAALWTRRGIQPLENSTRRAPACLVKLTSGSTGLPRPLFFEDARMLADGRQVADTMGIRSTDTNLALIPFGHSYGLGNLVMPLIQLGAAVAVCREPFPHSIAKAIRDSGATVVPAVPAILNALSQSAIDPAEVRGVRLWISAGSPLAPADARQFHAVFGKRIHNFYGSSETGGIAYDRTGKDTLSGRSVGSPMRGVAAGLSASGRLRVSSAAVFRRGNPHRDGDNGAHVLADLASLLEDGCIMLQGRRTRLVKIAGKRVNLGEIERLLQQVKGVSSARVVDYVTPAGRTRLAAAVCPRVPEALLIGTLKQQLPSWKIPDKWLTVPAFPLTSRGKINFRELDALLRG